MHNDHLPSLGGSPNIYYLDHRDFHCSRWHNAAKPLTKEEIEYLMSNEQLSFDILRIREKIISSPLQNDRIDSAIDRAFKALEIAKKELELLEEYEFSDFSSIEELRMFEEMNNVKIDNLREQVDQLEMEILSHKTF